MSYKGKLIISGNNAKTVKGDGDAFETAIMYLAPFTQAGVGNVCSMAALAACWQGCLNTAGRGAMNSVQAARVRKTKQYMTERVSFLAQLVEDLEGFAAYCKRKGVKPCVRLNGTSDIMWEKGHPVTRNGARFASLMEAFPEVQFYDYTKIYTRVDKPMPSNYSLTLSYSEANSQFAYEVLTRVQHGRANMAVVFRDLFTVGHYMGVGFKDLPCIDGDKTDMRFLDLQGGNVVALYAKGKAKHDTSGFVID
jgi:hypothetical protein